MELEKQTGESKQQAVCSLRCCVFLALLLLTAVLCSPSLSPLSLSSPRCDSLPTANSPSYPATAAAMASASDDDAASERCCGSYSPSADVSESETSSDCSAPTASTRRFASSSSATVSRLASSSSSLPTPASAAAFYLSNSKPAADLSGAFPLSSLCLDLTPLPPFKIFPFLCSFLSREVLVFLFLVICL